MPDYRLDWYGQSYVVVKFTLWMLLTAAVVVDAWLHRGTHLRGFQLHRCISACLGLFLLEAMLSMIWGMQSDTRRVSLFQFMVFCDDLAHSSFLGLLILISTGWCITREWSVLKKRYLIFAFPIVNFFTSLTVDYILGAELGVEEQENGVSGPVYIEDSWKRTIFLAADFIRLLSLFYGWWWMFVCLGENLKALRARIAGRQGIHELVPVTPADGASDTTGGTTTEPMAEAWAKVDLDDTDDDDEVVLEVVATGSAPLVTATTAVSTPVAPAYGDVDDEEDAQDAGLPGSDGLPDQAKLRLLTQFRWLVQIYLLAVILVIIYRAWKHETNAALAITMDMLVLMAMMGLSFTFRLRAANPYFMLEDQQPLV